MQQKKLNFIDLFSGCGGFSYGMEMAGHKCLLGVDFEPKAIESFAQNHPHAQAICIDIHKLSKRKLESLIDINNIDMVVGGPPCQGFSTVGRGDVNDDRNSLFKQFVRIVKLTRPKFVVFENVTGILANKNSQVLEHIFRSFERLGYNMDARVLSADEYGVPSRRRRAIIMGVRNGLPSFPAQTHGVGRKKLVSVKKALSKISHLKRTPANHDVKAALLKSEVDRARLAHVPAGSGIRYERDEKAYLPKKLWYDVDWKKIREGRFRQTRLQRLPLEDPAPTILTSRSMYYHPTENRYLTCREAALCQSFPNSFVFKGNNTQIFRQIGNAVPPLLAKAIGEHLSQIRLDLKQKRRSLNLDDKIRKSAFHYKQTVKA